MGKPFQRKDRNDKDWYISYYEPGGKRIKRRIGPNKRLAEAALKKIEKVGMCKEKAIRLRYNESIKVRKHPKSPYIFCHPNGERVKDIRKCFWTALKKSGIKDFHFHDLSVY